MNGSGEDLAEHSVGVILSQTDGVGLTSTLMATPPGKRAEFLSDFFTKQISAITKFAALDPRKNGPHWHVIDTTGDGFVFTVNITEGSEKDVFELYLRALLEMHATLGSIRIRSVSHFCPKANIIYGEEIDFDRIFPQSKSGILKCHPELLATEFFGQDRIVLSRLMAIAKGPFNILTEPFVRALTGKPTTPLNDMPENLADMNSRLPSRPIDPNPIRLPIIRGFTSIRHDNPYLLWELKGAAGQ